MYVVWTFPADHSVTPNNGVTAATLPGNTGGVIYPIGVVNWYVDFLTTNIGGDEPNGNWVGRPHAGTIDDTSVLPNDHDDRFIRLTPPIALSAIKWE
jgi:hypothetical protein